MGLTGGRTEDKLAAEENKTHPETYVNYLKGCQWHGIIKKKIKKNRHKREETKITKHGHSKIKTA